MTGGLIVATVLTITFVPALYVAWFGLKKPDALSVKGEGASQS
jgi:Cu/Ag efflux pump CusA